MRSADYRRYQMKRRYLGTSLLAAVLLGIGNVPASGQGPAIRPRKPVLIVSGTAIGTTLAGVVPVEELVVHNDGLVTLETAADTESCRTLRRFVAPAAVERLRTDLLTAGAFSQGDFNTGQTADLPHTTVTIFRGGSSRLDQTNSFTYERVSQLPKLLTGIRALIQTFVETTFPDFRQNGCVFPF
jgi:hypothetical protein